MPEPLRQEIKVEYETDGLEESAADLKKLSAIGRAEHGVVKDNIEDVLDWYQDHIPDRTIWLVSVVNETDYARYLHDRTGYWVMNDGAALNILEARLEELVDALDDRGTVADKEIRDALTQAAEDIIDFYTDVQGQKDTDGREMDAPRPQHRGQWADDTVTLARGFVGYLGGQRGNAENSGEEVASSENYSSPRG